MQTFNTNFLSLGSEVHVVCYFECSCAYSSNELDLRFQMCLAGRVLSMGNSAKRQRQRHGIRQPSPATRESEAMVVEDDRIARQNAARVRKSNQRAREREREHEARDLAAETSTRDVSDVLSVRDMNRVSLRIAQFIVGELRGCPGPYSRKEVVERVMRHNSVWPLLPNYYPRPQEAIAIHAFLENFKNELQLVKLANSNNLLARKSALLDAAMSLGVDGVAALSRVLETSPSSLTLAMNRRVYGANPDERVPRLRLNRQKREGVSDYIKQQVEEWWNSQTKVSPNKKDIVRQNIGRKLWSEPHPTHYLCETQVTLIFSN